LTAKEFWLKTKRIYLPTTLGANSITVLTYRISRFAGYVKYNMPLGATYENPQLTDEEAWDLAAYVNNLPRPSKDLSKDCQTKKR
jgi:thiosulfate dehydrogenase